MKSFPSLFAIIFVSALAAPQSSNALNCESQNPKGFVHSSDGPNKVVIKAPTKYNGFMRVKKFDFSSAMYEPEEKEKYEPILRKLYEEYAMYSDKDNLSLFQAHIENFDSIKDARLAFQRGDYLNSYLLANMIQKRAIMLNRNQAFLRGVPEDSVETMKSLRKWYSKVAIPLKKASLMILGCVLDD